MVGIYISRVLMALQSFLDQWHSVCPHFLNDHILIFEAQGKDEKYLHYRIMYHLFREFLAGSIEIVQCPKISQ